VDLKFLSRSLLGSLKKRGSHSSPLSGYRKLYGDKKKIRIVYKIVAEKVLVQVIAVGKREDMKVYKKAAKRF